MSFVTPTFAVFLALVLAVYVPVRWRLQNLLLLLASATFYGWEHPSWVLLLYVSAGIDFLAAIGMERWPAHKRPLLATSLGANLALLAWFKYAMFAADNLRALGADVPLLDVVLPAGISFYTFQSMSYTIDVYRGVMPACRSILDYFLFVSFFPQLVAGPIERAPDLLRQVLAPRVVTANDIGAGLLRATWGVAKKVIVADNVAVYVDRVYGLPTLSLPLALAGAFAFAVQILADFSGYTDIARGVAQCFGFTLSPNFLHPYLAANPTELWRRWHVSFSSWIRDYVYVPLGGSKGSAFRVAAVTVLTMATSGLWHGASWNFVLWGVYHGLLVVLYRPLWRVLAPLPRWLTVPLFFCFTVFGWAIFRQHDASVLVETFRHPWPVHPTGELIVGGVVLAVGACGGALLVLGLVVERTLVPRLGALRPAFAVGFVALVATLLVYWTRTNADAFIYFRF
ncbi:MAG: MBOAT family protein [Myxococcales bacterium]|nr:MBOAT family protein [Myxococcales bacterium]